MLARLLRHGNCPTVVTQAQACDHHGDPCGQMQRVRQGVKPHGQGKREQHFDLIVVDTLEHPVGDESSGES